jgi:pimeloyl-ACP methyl ester carboxylesterase
MSKSLSMYTADAVKWTMPRLESFWPQAAGQMTVRMFVRPLRRPARAPWISLQQNSWQKSFRVNNKRVMSYTWGSGDRHILLVHGWSGSASQFSSLIPKLVEGNFRVTAVDLPAHGKSSGSSTNILEVSDSLLMLQQEFGKFDGVVSHSFGDLCVLHAQSKGLRIPQLVTVAPTLTSGFVLDEFARQLNIGEYSKKYLVKWIKRKFNFDMKELNAHNLLKANGPMMIIHDKDDNRVDISQSREFTRNHPDVQLIETESLGHFKILHDQPTLDQVKSALMPTTPSNSPSPFNSEGIIL